MQELNKAIDTLREISDKANPVAMTAMDADSFGKLLARIHGVINHYFQRRGSNERSVDVINLGCLLLCAVVDHHVSNNMPATKNTVHIFEETAKLILKIIDSDFHINQSEYDKARLTSINLRALKACGITPLGHMNTLLTGRHHDHEGVQIDDDALSYAANHIVEFTQFVHELASNHQYVVDPLSSMPGSQIFQLFEKLSSLAFPSGIPISNH